MAPIAVTVVHGTRPRGAPWINSDSTFCAALRAGLDLDIHRFDWSGKNSATARSAAAESLSKFLTERLERQSDRKHFVVAHSHGGNVALLPLSRNRDLRERLGGIACLSTPFIHVRRRFVGVYGLSYLPFVTFFGALGLLALSAPTFEPLDERAAAVIVTVATLVGYGKLNGMGDLLQRRANNYAHAVDVSGSETINVLVVRTVGDEAQGAISTGQFLAWAASSAWGRLTTTSRDISEGFTNSGLGYERVLTRLGHSGLANLAALAITAYLAATSHGGPVWEGATLLGFVLLLTSALITCSPTTQSREAPFTLPGWLFAAAGVCLAIGFVVTPWTLAAVGLLVPAIFGPLLLPQAWELGRRWVAPVYRLLWSVLLLGAIAAACHDVANTYLITTVLAAPAAFGLIAGLIAIARLALRIAVVLPSAICAAITCCAAGLVFGFDAMLPALKLEITVDPDIRGAASTVTLPWRETTSSMVHSIYEDPAAISIVKDWITRSDD